MAQLRHLIDSRLFFGFLLVILVRGRGGSHGVKSGGTGGIQHDIEPQIMPPHSNISFFQFLREGTFEKDQLAYCSNRLAEYTCIYWLNATFARNNTTGEFPANGTGNAEFNNSSLRRVGINMINWTNWIVVPLLFGIVLVSNMIAMIVVHQLSRARLPLAIYLFYLTGIDTVELLLRGVDILADLSTGYKLFTMLQFYSRLYCKTIPITFSVLKHVHAILYIGFAIDSLKFARSPVKHFSAYRVENMKNVLILALVVAMTMDGQFFWTLDLTTTEKRLLHGRVVYDSFECGFSQNWLQNSFFQMYIWPTVDHLTGDIFPFLCCTICGIHGLILARSDANMFRLKTMVARGATNPFRFLLDPNLVKQAVPTFPRICLAYSSFLFLRVVTYLAKIIYHTTRATSRPGNVIFNGAEVIEQDSGLAADTQIHLLVFSIAEIIVLLSTLFSMLTRTALLAIHLDEFRARFFNVAHRMYSPFSRQRTTALRD